MIWIRRFSFSSSNLGGQMFQKRLPAFAENSKVFRPLRWVFTLIFRDEISTKRLPWSGFLAFSSWYLKMGTPKELGDSELGVPIMASGSIRKTWGVFFVQTTKGNIFSKESLAPCSHFWCFDPRASSVPSLVQLGAMVRPVTRRSPFAWAVAEPFSQQKKRQIFFGVLF